MIRRRLTGDEAREARILRATGFTFRDLGELYGLSPSAISKLVHGQCYAWAGGPVEPKIPLAAREPPEHGRAGRYGPGYRCRCEICRAANTARSRRDRAKRRERQAAR